MRSMQEKFSSWYPYLRINFFRKENGTSPSCFSPEVRMGEINKSFENASYDMGEYTSVAGLEKTFRDQFGLPVQVSRRSGNLWLETRLTDHLTLMEQNSIGEEISGLPFTNLPFAQVPYGC